jgi:hypothetical protein
MGNDEQLAVSRLDRIRAERLDAEKRAEGVPLGAVRRETRLCVAPPLQDVRRALVHPLQVLVAVVAGQLC